jgi:hypothetical protein
MGPPRVLIKEEDATFCQWTIKIGECGLSISLKQLKLKDYRNDSNKSDTISKWHIWKNLVAMVQELTSKCGHKTS